MPIAGRNSGNLNTIRMDFTVRRYDTFSETFNIEYYDSDGILQEVDLTDGFAQMWVKKKKTDTIPTLVMDVNLSGNEITISKDRNAMNLARGSYWHDIEVKDADGNHITWIEGRFIVLEHITEYIDEHLKEYYTYFTTLLSFFDVPKKIIKSTFQSIITFLPGVPWLIYPPIGSSRASSKFRAIISFMDQLRWKFKAVFSNVVVINDCKKLVYKTGWSAILSDATTILFVGDNNHFDNILRIYGNNSSEGPWVLQYDSGNSFAETP